MKTGSPPAALQKHFPASGSFVAATVFVHHCPVFAKNTNRQGIFIFSLFSSGPSPPGVATANRLPASHPVPCVLSPLTPANFMSSVTASINLPSAPPTPASFYRNTHCPHPNRRVSCVKRQLKMPGGNITSNKTWNNKKTGNNEDMFAKVQETPATNASNKQISGTLFKRFI